MEAVSEKESMWLLVNTVWKWDELKESRARCLVRIALALKESPGMEELAIREVVMAAELIRAPVRDPLEIRESSIELPANTSRGKEALIKSSAVRVESARLEVVKVLVRFAPVTELEEINPAVMILEPRAEFVRERFSKKVPGIPWSGISAVVMVPVGIFV